MRWLRAEACLGLTLSSLKGEFKAWRGRHASISGGAERYLGLLGVGLLFMVFLVVRVTPSSEELLKDGKEKNA